MQKIHKHKTQLNTRMYLFLANVSAVDEHSLGTFTMTTTGSGGTWALTGQNTGSGGTWSLIGQNPGSGGTWFLIGQDPGSAAWQRHAASSLCLFLALPLCIGEFATFLLKHHCRVCAALRAGFLLLLDIMSLAAEAFVSQIAGVYISAAT